MQMLPNRGHDKAFSQQIFWFVIVAKTYQVLLMTLTMTLIFSHAPVSHDSVTVINNTITLK